MAASYGFGVAASQARSTATPGLSEVEVMVQLRLDSRDRRGIRAIGRERRVALAVIMMLARVRFRVHECLAVEDVGIANGMSAVRAVAS